MTTTMTMAEFERDSASHWSVLVWEYPSSPRRLVAEASGFETLADAVAFVEDTAAAGGLEVQGPASLLCTWQGEAP